jgi:hypothetical protein
MGADFDLSAEDAVRNALGDAAFGQELVYVPSAPNYYLLRRNIESAFASAAPGTILYGTGYEPYPYCRQRHVKHAVDECFGFGVECVRDVWWTRVLPGVEIRKPIKPLRVMFAFFPYGGNGGVSSECPTVRHWYGKVCVETFTDPRVEFRTADFSDTPITMTRNLAIEVARQEGCDIIVMCDSDMAPDLYVLDTGPVGGAKPFWSSTFDYMYCHYHLGPVCVGAPYCGPPRHPTVGGMSSVYVFQWQSLDDAEDSPCALKMYTREHAARLTGISPVAAIATGLIAFDMRLFDLLPKPYFDYEWMGDVRRSDGLIEPGPRSRKASTEDVFCTRDLSLIGSEKLGYNPVLCNWDAWAGHWKPWCIGKPRVIHAEEVSWKYMQAARSPRSVRDRFFEPSPVAELQADGDLPDLRGAGDGEQGAAGEASEVRPMYGT